MILNEDKRTVVLISGSLRKGGAERVMSNLANYFVDDYNVVLVTLLPGGIEYQIDNRVKIVSFASNFPRIVNAPFWIFKINRLYRLYDPIAVISFIGRINILAILSGFFSNKKIIVSERNDPLRDGRSRLLLRSTELLYRFTYRVVFQTQGAKEVFKDKRIKSEIIPNPVSSRFVKLVKDDNDLCKIIAIGRLVPQKNFYFLILAVNKIIQEKLTNVNISVSIFGEGVEYESLFQLVCKLGLKEVIVFQGITNDVESELLNHDIYVSTSSYEGLSNAMLEAAAIGLPIVTTRVNGTEFISEAESSAKFGFVVEQNDLVNFTDSLLLLIEDPALRRKFGRLAHEASEKFSPESVYSAWGELIN